MVRAEEISTNDGQIQFSLAALGVNHLQPMTTISKKRAAAVADASVYQLKLSGERVLIGFAAAGGFIGVFMWALIRLWLFEP